MGGENKTDKKKNPPKGIEVIYSYKNTGTKAQNALEQYLMSVRKNF